MTVFVIDSKRHVGILKSVTVVVQPPPVPVMESGDLITSTVVPPEMSGDDRGTIGVSQHILT